MTDAITLLKVKTEILLSNGGAAGGLVKITCPVCKCEDMPAIVACNSDWISFKCGTPGCVYAAGPRNEFYNIV